MTDQPLTKVPPGDWEWHSLDTDEDEAAVKFVRKHGKPPETIDDVIWNENWPSAGRRWGVMICGPIDGRNGDA